MAAIAGIFLTSRLDAAAVNAATSAELDAIAACVIGGTSLFGGRGKPIHGVLGGLLIGGIAYGVSLMNLGSLSIPLEYILPGAVLLLAVLVDVLSRRGARTGSVIRV